MIYIQNSFGITYHPMQPYNREFETIELLFCPDESWSMYYNDKVYENVSEYDPFKTPSNTPNSK